MNLPPDLLDLLQAVSASPEDAPRLVLADWLEENGNEGERARAELIRLQCRLGSLADSDPEREALEARQQELLRRHGAAWLGPWRRGVSAEHHRGLLVIHAHARIMLRAAGADPAAFAWLERWHIPEGNPIQEVGNLLALPALDPVRGIVVAAIRRAFAAELRPQPSHLETLLTNAENERRKGPPRSYHESRSPGGAHAEHVRRLAGHRDLVHELALMPDGDTLLSASEDGTVGVWSLARGERLRTLTGHSAPINTLSLSPDGRSLVTGSDDSTVRIWSTRSWSVRRVLKGHGGYIRRVVAGSRCCASASHDGTVRIWDLATGAERHLLTAHQAGVFEMALSPDERLLCTISIDNVIIVWDFASVADVRRMEERKRAVVQLGGGLYLYTGRAPAGRGHARVPKAVLFRGEQVVTGGDGLIFWDIATGQDVLTLPGHGCTVRALALLPDGRIASGGLNGVRVWDVGTGEMVGFQAVAREVNALLATPDGRALVAGCRDGMIHVFSPEEVPPQCHADSVVRTLVERSGEVGLSVGGDGTLRLWDLGGGRRHPPAGRPLEVPLVSEPRPCALVAGRVVASGAEGELRVWDTGSGEMLFALKQDEEDVFSLGVLPDGRKAVVGKRHGPLLRWDLAPGATPVPFEGDTGWVDRVWVSPDGTRAVTRAYFTPPGGEENVHQLQGWDVPAARLLWTRPLAREVEVLAFTADGKLLLTTPEEEKRLPVRSASDGAVVRTLPAETPLAVVPLKGSVVLAALPSGRNGLAFVRWDLAGAKVQGEVATGLHDLKAVALAADGKRAAVVQGGEVVLLETGSGRVLGRFAGQSPVLSVALAPGGRTVLAGEWGGWARVFRLGRGRPRASAEKGP